MEVHLRADVEAVQVIAEIPAAVLEELVARDRDQGHLHLLRLPKVVAARVAAN